MSGPTRQDGGPNGLPAERRVNYIASLVTITNFVFSVIVVVSAPSLRWPNAPATIGSNPVRLIVFVALQSALAWVAAWALLRIVAIGPGFPRVFGFVIAFASAWTTFFNIQWIFDNALLPIADATGNVNGIAVWHFTIATVLAIVAALLIVYFISVHIRHGVSTPNDAETLAHLFIVVSFIIAWLITIFDAQH